MKSILLLPVIVVLGLGHFTFIFADSVPLKIYSVEGKSGYTPPDSDKWAPAQTDETVKTGGTIKTWQDGKVAVALGSEGAICVRNSTIVKLGEIKTDPTGRQGAFDIVNGDILLSLNPTTNPSDFKIKTPQGVAAARGTTYSAGIHGVTVLEGTVTFTGKDGGVIRVSSGYTLTPDGHLVLDKGLLQNALDDFESISKNGPIIPANDHLVHQTVQIALTTKP
jgi:hypothetical protein